MTQISTELQAIKAGLKLAATGVHPAKLEGVIAILRRDGWLRIVALASPHGGFSCYAYPADGF